MNRPLEGRQMQGGRMACPAFSSCTSVHAQNPLSTRVPADVCVQESSWPWNPL